MLLEFNGGRVFGKSWIPQAEFPSTPFDILKIGNGKWTFLGRKEERVKGELWSSDAARHRSHLTFDILRMFKEHSGGRELRDKGSPDEARHRPHLSRKEWKRKGMFLEHNGGRELVDKGSSDDARHRPHSTF